jgi:hypothetical protein
VSKVGMTSRRAAAEGHRRGRHRRQHHDRPGQLLGFSGLLYVQGNLTVREPCEIQGAVVVTGTVTIQGRQRLRDR